MQTSWELLKRVWLNIVLKLKASASHLPFSILKGIKYSTLLKIQLLLSYQTLGDTISIIPFFHLKFKKTS